MFFCQVLGAGDAFSAHRHPSSFLLEAPASSDASSPREGSAPGEGSGLSASGSSGLSFPPREGSASGEAPPTSETAPATASQAAPPKKRAPSSKRPDEGVTRLLIDCPASLPRMLKEARAVTPETPALHDLDQLIVTHLHADHASGLETVAFFHHFATKRRPTLYTIEEVARDLWEGNLRASMGTLLLPDLQTKQTMSLDDYFDLRILTPGQPQSIGPFVVTVRLTRHHIPAFGLVVQAEGRSLALSGDTCFDPDHLDFLAQADLIFHETGLGVHTPPDQLLALPPTLQKKMILYHLSDLLPTENWPLALAQEGQRYPVAPPP